MRTCVLALLVAAGCGGDGNGTNGTDGTDGPTAPVVDTALCDSIPQFATSGLNCDQVTMAFEQTMDAATDCLESSDCQVLSGQCTTFEEAACWYPVNQCVSSATVSGFVNMWMGCPVANQCQCQAAPEVDCIDNKCQWVGTY